MTTTSHPNLQPGVRGGTVGAMDTNDTTPNTAVPVGGRNLVRPGDVVRVVKGPVDPSGFKARVITIDPDTNTVCVYGGRGYDPARDMAHQTGQAQFRTFTLDRIRRMAQTRGGQARFAR